VNYIVKPGPGAIRTLDSDLTLRQGSCRSLAHAAGSRARLTL